MFLLRFSSCFILLFCFNFYHVLQQPFVWLHVYPKAYQIGRNNLSATSTGVFFNSDEWRFTSGSRYLSLVPESQLMPHAHRCSVRRVCWVKGCADCGMVHLIIRASIRKSISSCSEQISGRVCGENQRSSSVCLLVSRGKMSLDLISRQLNRQKYVLLKRLLIWGYWLSLFFFIHSGHPLIVCRHAHIASVHSLLAPYWCFTEQHLM